MAWRGGVVHPLCLWFCSDGHLCWPIQARGSGKDCVRRKLRTWTRSSSAISIRWVSWVHAFWRHWF